MTAPWDRADVEVDLALVRRLVDAQVSALAGAPIAPLDEGWDSRAFVVGGEWLFRFPKRAPANASLAVEIALLPRLELPVAIPRFEHVGAPADGYPYRFVGYRMLPGREAQDVWDELDPARLGADLGRVLEALHAFPVDEARAAGVAPDAWRDDLPGRARDVDTWLERLSPELRPRFAPLFDPPPRGPGPPRLVHGDVMANHVLVEQGALAGLIDWGDVCLGDPAIDLGGVLFVGGPAALRACLDAYRHPLDPGAVARARYVALFAAMMDVSWAQSTGRPASLAAALRAIEFCHAIGG